MIVSPIYTFSIFSGWFTLLISTTLNYSPNENISRYMLKLPTTLKIEFKFLIVTQETLIHTKCSNNNLIFIIRLANTCR